MKDLKIKVNSEAESKEAQELFFELGYQWAYKNIGKNIFYEKEDIFLYADKDGNLGTGTKENEVHFNGWNGTLVSLVEIRDLVVLKRNDPKDATHTDQDNWKWFISSSGVGYVWQCGNSDNLKQWDESSLDMVDLKPIEKTMKEYLLKSGDGKYLITKHESNGTIEIPKWAKTAYKNENGSISFTNSEDIGHIIHDDISLVWKRAQQPEELPFIDDDPKITTAKGSKLDYIAKIHDMRDRYDGESDEDYRHQLEHYISRKELSLNDQYAEIEKVRQDIINSPSHYADSAIECIDAMEAMMTPEQFIGYLRGNVFKYQWRYEKKNGIEDLKKAQWYLERLTEKVAEKNAPF